MLFLRWTTAVCLVALAVVLLWRPRRTEAARVAFGVVVAVNAALVLMSLGLVFGLANPRDQPVLYSLFLATFVLSPVTLSAAVDRTLDPRPIRLEDLRTLWPAAAVFAALGALSIPASANGIAFYGDGPGFTVSILMVQAAVVPALYRIGAGAWRGPDWLRAVAGLFFLHWIASASSSFTWLLGLPGGAELELASLALLLAFGCAAALLAARRATAGLPAYEPPVELSPEDEQLEASVLAAFEEDGLHRDPDLSIQSLATRLGVRERDLSRVLNARLGGYRALLRRYRVREAQRQLRERPDATVLTVLYAAGFNSKSAFHRAFEEEVGMSPGDYRRHHSTQPS